jgi:hypothetical protein
VDEFKSQYNHIFFLRADKAFKLAQGFLDVARHLALALDGKGAADPNDARELVIAWLQGNGKQALVNLKAPSVC